MTRQDDEGERARRRQRLKERGLIKPEEAEALEWLATMFRRLDVNQPWQIDWHTVAAWDSHHWPKLQKALQYADLNYQNGVQGVLRDYSLQNGLLIEIGGPPPRPKKSMEEQEQEKWAAIRELAKKLAPK